MDEWDCIKSVELAQTLHEAREHDLSIAHVESKVAQSTGCAEDSTHREEEKSTSY